MSKVSIYLNFDRETEAAFLFYQSVFGGEFEGGINRMGDAPSDPIHPLSDDDKNLVMHISLPLFNNFILMGTDAPESMGFHVIKGNNVNINLLIDSREESDRIFESLSEGGHVGQRMQEMFWGDYFGYFTDKFGVCWMINCSEKSNHIA